MKKINKNYRNVLYVDPIFWDEDGTVYVEEDYVDLADLATEYSNTDICSMENIIGRTNLMEDKE